jgi:hypothetical protein
LGVYGIERDHRSEIKIFPSLEEARREAIQRCIISAKIMLNHPCRNAHPELKLPDPGKM